MIQFFKRILKRVLGVNLYQKLILGINFYTDFKLYKKHSSVFKKDTYEKIESEITLRYHSLEKGFLHNPIRYKFAKSKVIELIQFLKKEEIAKCYDNIQIQSAFNSLCKYYEFHSQNNIVISDYYSINDYQFFKNNLHGSYDTTKIHSKTSFWADVNKEFKTFSNSRCSVRNFTGEKIPKETLQDVVNLANNAPSVCNRQPVSVHILENKVLIDSILEIQGGLKGYSRELTQLVVLTCNRNYFYSPGERNQLYIDGGIYLMNFLYALHYYKIGACPAHWGLPVNADRKAEKILNLKESEQIICIVAIGIPVENFSTTLSLRKMNNENLFII